MDQWDPYFGNFNYLKTVSYRFQVEAWQPAGRYFASVVVKQRHVPSTARVQVN